MRKVTELAPVIGSTHLLVSPHWFSTATKLTGTFPGLKWSFGKTMFIITCVCSLHRLNYIDISHQKGLIKERQIKL